MGTRQEEYNLSRNYQIKENLVIMKLVLPVDIAFSIFFTLYLAGSTFVRLDKAQMTQVQYTTYYESIYCVSF